MEKPSTGVSVIVKPSTSSSVIVEPSTSRSGVIILEDPDETDDSSGRASPDNCSICLGVVSNKSFTDSCVHQFCFACLKQWSEVKAECPLCKQNFKSIYYNVRSMDNYDEYVLPVRAPRTYQFFELPSAEARFNAVNNRSTSSTDFHTLLIRTLASLEELDQEGRQQQDNSALEFLRLYQQGSWAQPIDNTRQPMDNTRRNRPEIPPHLISFEAIGRTLSTPSGTDTTTDEVDSEDDEPLVPLCCLPRLTPAPHYIPPNIASDSDDCVIVDTIPSDQPRPLTPEVITLESDDEVDQAQNTSINSLPQLEPAPSSYTVQAVDETVEAATSARSHLNVSININLPRLSQSLTMPNRRRGFRFRYSSHTDSSSSNGSPERKRPKRSKKLSKKKPQREQPVLNNNIDRSNKETPMVLPLKKRHQRPIFFKSSSSDSDDEPSEPEIVAEPVLDEPDEPDNKPRLKSVIVKTKIKEEMEDSDDFSSS